MSGMAFKQVSERITDHHVNNAFAPIQHYKDPYAWAGNVPQHAYQIEVLSWNLFENEKPSVRQSVQNQLFPWFHYSSGERAFTLEAMMTEQELNADNCQNHLLWGQKGVFARHFIPAFTVLGPYAGRFIDDNQKIAHELDTYDDHELSRYLFSCSLNGGFPFISGFGSGNIITVVNDCRPAVCEKIKGSNKHWFEAQNCSSITVKAGDLSGVFYVACKDIPVGKEILVDYGDNFWK